MKLTGSAFKWSGEALVFFLLAVSLLQMISDWDIWYHLSIGRQIAETFSIPAYEFLVYPNADQPGAYHEWGFGLMFHGAYQLAGFWGMAVLNASLAALTLWFLFRAVDRNVWASPAYLIVLLAVLLCMHFRFVYRPENVLFVTLAAQILFLERFCEKLKPAWLMPVPFLGFVLTQAHPSVIFLMVVLGAYGLHVVWQHRANPRLALKYSAWFLLCGVAMAAFALINPYGLQQLLLPLSFVQQERVTLGIQEFLPVVDTARRNQFLLVAAASVAALLMARRKRLVDWLLLLLFAYLAYRYVRNIALLAMVMYVPIARTASELLDRGARLLGTVGTSVRARQFRAAAWVVAGTALLSLLVTEVTGWRWGAGPLPGMFPEKSVEVIEEIQPPGQIFNNYELGGYLGWALGDRYRVFIDGRHYTFSRALAAYRSISYAKAGWRRALAAFDVNAIVYPPKIAAGNLLPLLTELVEDPAWVLTVAENRELLFLRAAAIPDLPVRYRMDKEAIWPMVVYEARLNIASFPSKHSAYLALGEALLRLGERQQAIEAFRQYVALEPSDDTVIQRLSRLESPE